MIAIILDFLKEFSSNILFISVVLFFILLFIFYRIFSKKTVLSHSEEQMGLRCKKCSMKMRSYSNFCPNCGEQLLSKCEKCGYYQEEWFKFCINCGSSMTKNDEIKKIADVVKSTLPVQSKLEMREKWVSPFFSEFLFSRFIK